jgi:hypothetical protein
LFQTKRPRRRSLWKVRRLGPTDTYRIIQNLPFSLNHHAGIILKLSPGSSTIGLTPSQFAHAHVLAFDETYWFPEIIDGVIEVIFKRFICKFFFFKYLQFVLID